MSQKSGIGSDSVEGHLSRRSKRLLRLMRRLIVILLIWMNGWVVAEPLPNFPLGVGCSTSNNGGVAYLSQLVQENVIPVNDGVCDAAQLQNLIFQLGQGGTLMVVDMACVLNAGLRLPSRFALKGLGIGVAGTLSFTHDGIALSGCPEKPHGYITIADLEIYGPNPAANKKIAAPHATGIALSNQHIVFIDNVRVSDFVTGISGVNSFSVFINGSNVSDNRGDNIRVGYHANSWRIRDGLISQAGGWGINVLGPGDTTPLKTVENGKSIIVNGSNDLLIDGVRMESNSRGGVRTNSYGTRITNLRLEGNGKRNFSFPRLGLLVDRGAQDIRILSNLSSGNCIRDVGADTQRAFNIPSDLNTRDCSQLPIAPP